MSFKVNWSSLSETDSLRNWTKELLTEALNSGKRPNILASDISIKALDFGKVAPDFEILEIGELDKDRFRGIFKINYDGDFHLTLHTKVQANPLKIYSDNSCEREVGEDRFATPSFVLSNDPFNLPLDLKLSDIKISGIGIIVFSKSKGLTVVFRNDPLDSIKVSSTFDTVQVLAKFLQKQIENQIRDLFRETLPTLLHQLSLKYTLFNDKSFLDLNKFKGAQASDNSFDYDKVSASNLNKILQMFSSRESLKLNVPKFKRIIQRSHLDKLNKHTTPNLLNSLNLDGAEKFGEANSNGIPIDLLQNRDYFKVDDILKEISVIQLNNFKSNNSNNNVPAKPKRRTIKISRASKSKMASPKKESLERRMSLEDKENSASETSTLLSNIQLPKPIRMATDLLVHSHSHFHLPSHLSASPVNSNSSLLSGVGLGNNYFNFTNNRQIAMSPVRQQPYLEDDKAEKKEKLIGYKKSMNHIDIEKINANLKRLNFDALNKGLEHQQNRLLFEVPPPPYS